MGQRRERSRRVAAPDLSSGQNFNTPIQLYDIKPNARFTIGDVVIPVDEKGIPFRGVVMGHVAEDCLWVKWPTEIAQAHVEEVMPVYDFKGQGIREYETLATPLAASRNFPRVATLDFSAIPQDDGDNYDAFDSLPGEQDPQEKIDDSSPEDSVITLIDIESICGQGADRTDFVEGLSRESSRREAIFFGKKKTPLDEIRKQEGFQGKSDRDIYLNYNIFEDPVLSKFFKEHGLSDAEVGNFARLRGHQLEQMRQKAAAPDPNHPLGIRTNDPYEWGRGSGVSFNIRGKTPQTQTAPAPRTTQTAPASQAAPAGQGAPLMPGGEPVGVPPGQPPGGRWGWDAREGRFRYWPPSGQGHIPPRPAPPGTTPQTAPTQTHAASRLDHHSDLVGGMLGMQRVAALVRQASAVARAASDLVKDEEDVDPTVTAAIRNATHDLLLATDHLRNSPNRIARRVADQIEADYAESLSTPLGR